MYQITTPTIILFWYAPSTSTRSNILKQLTKVLNVETLLHVNERIYIESTYHYMNMKNILDSRIQIVLTSQDICGLFNYDAMLRRVSFINQ